MKLHVKCVVRPFLFLMLTVNKMGLIISNQVKTVFILIVLPGHCIHEVVHSKESCSVAR